MGQDLCMHCSAVAISKVIKMLNGMTEVSRHPEKIPSWLRSGFSNKMINQSGDQADHVKNFLTSVRNVLIVEANKAMVSQLELEKSHTKKEIDGYVQRFTDEMMCIDEDPKEGDHLIDEAKRIIERGNS